MMGKFRRMTIRMPSGVIMQPEWDFGKTVFFDREEAEKAANGGHGNG